MSRLFQFLFVAFASLALAACGGGKNGGDGGADGGTVQAPGGSDDGGEDAETEAAAVPAPAGTTVVKGKVTLKGTPPARIDLSGKMVSHPACLAGHESPPLSEDVVTGEGGALANVFVYVSKGLEGKRFPRPTGAVKFDQKGCVYHPHVFGIRVGQTLEISNSDETLHNVHTLPKAQREYNSAHPKGSTVLKTKFKKAEPDVMVKIKCDVHPWMNAWAGVLTHPYFAVSGADGAFQFSDKLAPGEYTVTAWQETYQPVSKTIKVEAGQADATVDFEFEAK